MGLQEIVTFAGHLYDVEAALGCMDLFLSMSKREGLSVAVIEAMACGLPCVITNVGGAREQVEDERNGWVVQVGAIEQAVMRSEEILLDPCKREKMGQKSRQICEGRFEIETMVRQYQKIYREISRR
jgi:glycosyltransferase involved in cell wall biosynthesis